MSGDAENSPSAAEQCAASRSAINCSNSVFPDDRVTCCETARACTELQAALNGSSITCGGSKFCFSQWSVASGYCVQERDGYVAEVYPRIPTEAPPSATTTGRPGSVATATVTTTQTAGTNSPTSSSSSDASTAAAPTTPAQGTTGAAALNPSSGATGLNPSSVPGSSNNAVKIAVPIVVVLLLLLGGGLFLFWRRRRARQQQQQQQGYPHTNELEKAPGAQDIAELHEHFTAELAVHSPPVELPAEYTWNMGKSVAAVDVKPATVASAAVTPERMSLENSVREPGMSVPVSGLVTPQRRSLDGGPASPVSPMSPLSSMDMAFTAPSTPLRGSLDGPARPRS
ncbi:hypothetical protein BZA05DRAFT_204841 [Tricharina praecox]|uniref:uncharacterized protein n=1 Tax=Tricharina praecox TaxID=43433 RepID=UPI00221E45E8|nr:uncharacterized protein BZA05DRAFT_204841 [Tricharina praecox]KAI5856607.1 hypothetical protein BZA05DRAFT_204841 [Tricharina praecox]